MSGYRDIIAYKAVSHVINRRALTGQKPCINKAIYMLLINAMQLSICLHRGHRIRETSVKRQNKIVQEITRNIANVFSFYAIIAIEHGFSMH